MEKNKWKRIFIVVLLMTILVPQNQKKFLKRKATVGVPLYSDFGVILYMKKPVVKTGFTIESKNYAKKNCRKKH